MCERIRTEDPDLLVFPYSSTNPSWCSPSILSHLKVAASLLALSPFHFVCSALILAWSLLSDPCFTRKRRCQPHLNSSAFMSPLVLTSERGHVEGRRWGWFTGSSSSWKGPKPTSIRPSVSKIRVCLNFFEMMIMGRGRDTSILVMSKILEGRLSFESKLFEPGLEYTYIHTHAYTNKHTHSECKSKHARKWGAWRRSVLSALFFFLTLFSSQQLHYCKDEKEQQ